MLRYNRYKVEEDVVWRLRHNQCKAAEEAGDGDGRGEQETRIDGGGDGEQGTEFGGGGGDVSTKITHGGGGGGKIEEATHGGNVIDAGGTVYKHKDLHLTLFYTRYIIC